MRSACWAPSASPAPCGRHDWGGLAAILLALRHLERVDRLLLVNTPGPWARPSPSVVAGLRRAWYAGLVATPVLGERVVRHPRFVPWFLRLGGPGGTVLRRGRGALRRAVPRPGPGRRELAAVPLLPADGPGGPAGPRLRRTATVGADLTLEVVRGCGHWMPEERPDLIAERALALFG